MNLSGKRILFIARNFFDYDQIIINRLKGFGASVDMVFDVPLKSNSLKALLRVFPRILNRYTSHVILHECQGFPSYGDYDFIFVIIGEGLDRSTVSRLVSDNPKAKSILYLWDAISNNRSSVLTFSDKFDRVITFDPIDSDEHGFEFLPLFCDTGTDTVHNEIKYDCCFIGTAHSGRSKKLKDLAFYFSDCKINYFFFQYLQARWLYYVYNLYDGRYSGIPLEQFSFEKLSRKVCDSIVASSKCVLDFPHPKQKGLTIRTLECHLARRKLVTTNTMVNKYDFFHPANILILDDNVDQIVEFISTPYVELDDTFYDKYSLTNWLTEIFGVDRVTQSYRVK